MTSANLSLTAGHFTAATITRIKARKRLSEARLLKMGTLIVAAQIIFAAAVFVACNTFDAQTAATLAGCGMQGVM